MVTNYLNAKNGIEIWHDTGIVQILAGAPDPSSVGAEASIGSIYLCSSVSGTIFKKSGSGDTDWSQIATSTSGIAVQTFLDLMDTPGTYIGHIGKYPRINNTGTGIEFDYISVDNSDPDQPLIAETSISGTYFINFEGARLLRANTGKKPDLVAVGPVAGLAFADSGEESCYGSFKVPYAWNNVSDLKLTINFINDTAQLPDQVCSWGLEYQSYSHMENINTKTSDFITTDCTLSGSWAAGSFHTCETFIPYTTVNTTIDRGDILCFRFYRNASAEEDTVDGDAVLVTLMFELQTGQHENIGGD